MNKKGSTELNIVIFGVIFLFLTNVSLGFVIDTYVEGSDLETSVDSYVNDTLDLGVILGAFVSGILWVITIFFSLFGVNFIGALIILPIWVLGFLAIINSLVIFALIMYFVDRLWIG